MMGSLRHSSVRLALVALLPLAVGCGDDGKSGATASDTSTGTDGTADEVGDADTMAGESATTSSESSDTTASDTSQSTTDATDTTTDTSDTTTTDTTETTESTGDGTTGGDDGDCAGVCGTPDCGDCPDNDLVNLPGDYSMGATEVRNSHYAAFLAVEFTSEFLASWLPAECDWKADFTPDDWPANPNADLPVTNVDWCDAWAYCEWSGQHLCGKIGGGPALLGDVQNPAMNQWYKACSGGGLKNYPYGLEYMADACNGVDAGFGQLTMVGSLMACGGGYAGLHDLSGNVWEWENACDTDPMIPVEDRECRRRGGSYFSDGPTLRCAVSSLRARNFRDNNLGIRCCDMP